MSRRKAKAPEPALELPRARSAPGGAGGRWSPRRRRRSAMGLRKEAYLFVLMRDPGCEAMFWDQALEGRNERSIRSL